MKMRNYSILSILFLSGVILFLGACNEESPGIEYMPDMYRSPAIEPYVDNEEYGNTNEKSVREPVAGTIPRGFMPVAIEEGDEGYEAAGADLQNPIVLNEKVLDEGKELYGMFCKHCHGAKGDGKGTITHVAYGNVPSYADATPARRGGRAMKDLKAGHIFHVMTYGLNAMGPHASQITIEERWKIVHYVQTLQGNDKAEEETTEETAEPAEGEGEAAEEVSMITK